MFSKSFQFQLGHVETVFNGKGDFRPNEGSSPESAKILFSPYNRENEIVKIPAIPLLRGVSDSITRGDLVLYTEIGNQFFYLGPINTRNKVSNSSDHTYQKRRGRDVRTGDLSKDRGDGYNKLLPTISIEKLEKPRNDVLDFPAISNQIQNNTIMYYESNFTDFLLEGRYGNAIRIGARNQNPILNISNNNIGTVETLGGGGSIISMMSIGKIDDNFPNEIHLKKDSENLLVDEPGFRWACDSENGEYLINAGNDEVDENFPHNRFNYDYGQIFAFNPEDRESRINDEFDQIIISSDRIIFDSTREDITISSIRNINFGAIGNDTVTNKGYSVFETKNIYIGKDAKDRTQPMVLGEELRKILTRILRVLADAQALGDMNVPQPLTLYPEIHRAGTLKEEVYKIMEDFNLGTLEPGIEPPSPNPSTILNVEDGVPIGDRITSQATFLSQYHFIEKNHRPDPTEETQE